MKTIVRLMVIGAFVGLFYQNCSPTHEDGVGSRKGGGGNDAAVAGCKAILVDGFSGYHTFLTQNCASCHVPGGGGKGSFAQDDVGGALEAFQLSGEGLVADRAVSTHQPPQTGEQHTAAIDDAAAKWADGFAEFQACVASSGDDGGGGIPIEEEGPRKPMVAKPIPNSEEYVEMTWDLSSEFLAAGDNVPGGHVLSVEVRRFVSPTDLNSYELRNPIVRAGANAVHFKDLRFEFNAKLYTVGTVWRTADRKIPANQERVVMPLAGGSGVMIIDLQTTPFGAADTLAPSISTLEATTFDPPSFSSFNAAGGVFAQSCNGCHSGGNPSAGLDLTNYDMLRAFVKPFTANGEVITRMKDNGAPMPPAGLIPAAQVKQIEDWILDGAVNN